MTPAEYAKVKEVFAAALDLPEPQRDRFVRQQCGDHDDAVAEVLSLLRHHRQETILEVPDGSGQTIIAAPPSQIVDPYLVLRDVWEDNQHILRRRLMVVSAVLAVLIAISTFRLFTYHFAEWGYGVRAIGFSICSLTALILHYRHDLTMTQIRAAELVVISSVGLLVIVIDVRLMLESAAAGDAATLISVTNWHCFSWTLIIFIYGVFMPNTWRRAAAVLVPIAAIPGLVTWVNGWFNPGVAELLRRDRFGQPLPTPFVAAFVAIYAAHLIHGSRLAASRAQQLAQYRIKRLIGRGGMGQVYEAEHLLLKRACAVKVILPEYCADDRVLQRFEREVRSTALLTHPHTIQVYDYGQTREGVFFFAMELLPGMNLRELVDRSGPMPAPRAVHFLLNVCQALGEAHASGLIHRDIKPANVFASQRGGIYDYTKLLDFGVVREIQIDPAQSISANMVAGTPAYMSPEQVTSPGSVDARSDLYALGGVAYYLLTGRPPFAGGSALELMSAQVNQIPAAPSTYQPGIPADLEAIVLRCLAKDPNERFESAGDLETELAACQSAGQWSQEKAAQWWSQWIGGSGEVVDASTNTA